MFIVHKRQPNGVMNHPSGNGTHPVMQFEFEKDALKFAQESVKKYDAEYIIFKAVSGVRPVEAPIEVFIPSFKTEE